MSKWLKEFDKMMYRHTYIKNAVSDDCIDGDTITIDSFDENHYDHLLDFVIDILWVLDNMVDAGYIQNYSLSHDGLKYVFKINEEKQDSYNYDDEDTWFHLFRDDS